MSGWTKKAKIAAQGESRVPKFLVAAPVTLKKFEGARPSRWGCAE